MASLPKEWISHVEDVLANPGITVVVGESDTGKTTLCSLLANRALESGIPAAVVDGDMGQSEIGPPTTIGLGLVESAVESIADLPPRALYFVGSTSPIDHLLPSAVGVKRLTEKAEMMECRLVIVDTTGLVRGAVGRKLKTHKIELLNPRHIIALQRTNEAEHFLRYFDTWEDCTIHRLSIAPGVKSKSPVLRTQRRAIRFREYFSGAEIRTLALGELATSGTWLRTGTPLETKYLKFAENALKTDVLHGERADRAIYLVIGREVTSVAKRGIEQLQEHFHTRNVIIVPANRYANLVVGLMGGHVDLLSLGVVRGIDFRAQTISLLTPLRSIAPVRSMRFGVLKLRADGTEIGRLRPGEL